MMKYNKKIEQRQCKLDSMNDIDVLMGEMDPQNIVVGFSGQKRKVPWHNR
jgi:hypothetical protein